MNYIVFDLEWNQSPDGKKNRNEKLPFEIIEIGAVKVNSKNEITDSFHRLIRPQVYNRIHSSIHEVIHMDYRDLLDGVSFEQAAGEFLENYIEKNGLDKVEMNDAGYPVNDDVLAGCTINVKNLMDAAKNAKDNAK